MSFDWLDSTKAQRKTLYQFFKRALDARNKSTTSLHFDLFGSYQSLNYDKSLQSGRYSAKKATPYFNWLKETDEQLAEQLLVELRDRKTNQTDAQANSENLTSDELSLIHISEPTRPY